MISIAAVLGSPPYPVCLASPLRTLLAESVLLRAQGTAGDTPLSLPDLGTLVGLSITALTAILAILAFWELVRALRNEDLPGVESNWGGLGGGIGGWKMSRSMALGTAAVVFGGLAVYAGKQTMDHQGEVTRLQAVEARTDSISARTDSISARLDSLTSELAAPESLTDSTRAQSNGG